MEKFPSSPVWCVTPREIFTASRTKVDVSALAQFKKWLCREKKLSCTASTGKMGKFLTERPYWIRKAICTALPTLAEPTVVAWSMKLFVESPDYGCSFCCRNFHT